MDTGSRALSLDFSGGVPFSFLASKLASSGLALTGSSNVNLQVRGTTNSPVIGGSLSTSGARFVVAASGIAINDIRAEIAMANNTATIRTLTGNLSTGGSISGSGTVEPRRRQRLPGRHKAQGQQRPLHGWPRRHHHHERRPRHQGAAGVEAGAVRHCEPGKNRHHRARPAAGVAGSRSMSGTRTPRLR